MQSNTNIKLNIIGNIYGSSGYANHTKGLANALYKLGDVKLTSQIPNGWELQTNDAELDMIKKADSFDRINLIIDLPMNWIQHCNRDKNIGFLVWEGDKIPLSWVEIIKDKRINQVWVPSSHTYYAVKNTMQENDWMLFKNKLKIIPHGADLNIFKKGKKERELFTFLANKGFRNEFDRGGLQHAIKAFIEEFNKGEASLILKLNPAYAMHPNELVKFINEEWKKTGKANELIPEIIFNYEFLSLDNLKNIYTQADVFLNPTEAEAFSLPCIEAMACGIPVITTNFGGQIDYITNQNGWLIDYELKEVRHELMYEGVNWAKPNLEQLKKAMRESWSNRELLNQKAVNASNDVLNWTWDNSANKALIALQEL